MKQTVFKIIFQQGYQYKLNNLPPHHYLMTILCSVVYKTQAWHCLYTRRLRAERPLQGPSFKSILQVKKNVQRRSRGRRDLRGGAQKGLKRKQKRKVQQGGGGDSLHIIQYTWCLAHAFQCVCVWPHVCAMKQQLTALPQNTCMQRNNYKWCKLFILFS